MTITSPRRRSGTVGSRDGAREYRALDPALTRAQPPPTSPASELDGQYSAACVDADGADVLLVTPAPGAPGLVPNPNAAWGLHIDDPNLALGNLVGLVRAEAAAFAHSSG